MSAGRWRFTVAAFLRLLGAAALLAWVAVVFHQPLVVILGNELKAAGLSLGLGDWLAPRSARGFLVNATSVPTGGTLLVDGAARGTTPTVANVACGDGRAIHLQVAKEGFATWQRTVLCREGQTLLVRARLAP